MNTTEKPTCPVCDSKVRGKANKDFCSVACKSKHHYIASLQAYKLKEINVNKFITRNYIILLGIFRGIANRVVVHRDVLFKHGFHQFQYIEDIKRDGKPFKQILEFEFREIQGGKIEIFCTEHHEEYYEEFIARWKIHFPDGFLQQKEGFMDKIERFFELFALDTFNDSTVIRFVDGERIRIPPIPI